MRETNNAKVNKKNEMSFCLKSYFWIESKGRQHRKKPLSHNLQKRGAIGAETYRAVEHAQLPVPICHPR